MVDLILRPSTRKPDRPWALQLRWHESLGETEYHTLARVSDATAREIIRAGAAFWLYGEPDWGAAERSPLPAEDEYGTARCTAGASPTAAHDLDDEIAL